MGRSDADFPLTFSRKKEKVVLEQGHTQTQLGDDCRRVRKKSFSRIKRSRLWGSDISCNYVWTRWLVIFGHSNQREVLVCTIIQLEQMIWQRLLWTLCTNDLLFNAQSTDYCKSHDPWLRNNRNTSSASGSQKFGDWQPSGTDLLDQSNEKSPVFQP